MSLHWPVSPSCHFPTLCFSLPAFYTFSHQCFSSGPHLNNPVSISGSALSRLALPCSPLSQCSNVPSMLNQGWVLPGLGCGAQAAGAAEGGGLLAGSGDGVSMVGWGPDSNAVCQRVDVFGRQSHSLRSLDLPAWVPCVTEAAPGTPLGLQLLLCSEQYRYPISYLSAPYGCLACLRILYMASGTYVCAVESSPRFPRCPRYLQGTGGDD